MFFLFSDKRQPTQDIFYKLASSCLYYLIMAPTIVLGTDKSTRYCFHNRQQINSLADRERANLDPLNWIFNIEMHANLWCQLCLKMGIWIQETIPLIMLNNVIQSHSQRERFSKKVNLKAENAWVSSYQNHYVKFIYLPNYYDLFAAF